MEPPASATPLISKGRLKPCHAAKLYSGGDPPTTGPAAAASTGPTDQAGRMPTIRQANTSSSTGTRIQNTGSCGWRGRSVESGPKKMSTLKRSEYATAKTPATVASSGNPISTHGSDSMYTVSAKNISLDRKPFSNGTPAIAALAT